MTSEDPVSEYALRHAANGLLALANRHPDLHKDDLDAINYAYQQLLRGANTIASAKAEASEHRSQP